MAKKNMKIDDEIESLPGNSMTAKVAPIREKHIREQNEKRYEEKRKARAEKGSGPISKGTKHRRTVAENVARGLFGSGMRSFFSQVLEEFIIPTAKTTVEDIIKGALDRILYGEESSSRARRDDKGHISYGSYYKKGEKREITRRPGKNNFDLDEIFFKRMVDASDVLMAMCENIEDYGQVSVADFFEMADIDGATWIHNKWGWTDLSKAYCTHTHRGYAIIMPDPEELD